MRSGKMEEGDFMINWRVRVRNKAFWAALIPAAVLLVQVLGAVFGLTLELDRKSVV